MSRHMDPRNEGWIRSKIWGDRVEFSEELLKIKWVDEIGIDSGLYDDGEENEDGTIKLTRDPEFIFPAEFVTCPTCRGRGKHVSPGVDSHGLTASDFAEDPDFAEDYWRGNYDVTCYECDGLRVVPQVEEREVEIWERLAARVKKLKEQDEGKAAKYAKQYEQKLRLLEGYNRWNENINDAIAYAHEVAMELRVGY